MKENPRHLGFADAVSALSLLGWHGNIYQQSLVDTGEHSVLSECPVPPRVSSVKGGGGGVGGAAVAVALGVRRMNPRGAQ